MLVAELVYQTGRGDRINPTMKLAFFLVAQLTFAASLPTAKPQDAGMSAERLARIHSAMQRYVDRDEIAGAVSLVARHGRVVYLDTAGMMDRDGRKPMKADAMFRIASMTKPITSLAAMMLYEEGAFQLNDPV